MPWVLGDPWLCAPLPAGRIPPRIKAASPETRFTSPGAGTASRLGPGRAQLAAPNPCWEQAAPHRADAAASAQSNSCGKGQPGRPVLPVCSPRHLPALLLALVAFTPKNNPVEPQRSPSLLSTGKAYQHSTLNVQCVKENKAYSGPHFRLFGETNPAPVYLLHVPATLQLPSVCCFKLFVFAFLNKVAAFTRLLQRCPASLASSFVF